MVEDEDVMQAFVAQPEMFDKISGIADNVLASIDTEELSQHPLYHKAIHYYTESQAVTRELIQILHDPTSIPTEQLEKRLMGENGLSSRIHQIKNSITEEEESEIQAIISGHVDVSDFESLIEGVVEENATPFKIGAIKLPTLEDIATRIVSTDHMSGRENAVNDARDFTEYSNAYMNARIAVLEVLGTAEATRHDITAAKDRVTQSFAKAMRSLNSKASYANKAKVLNAAHQEYIGCRMMMDDAISGSLSIIRSGNPRYTDDMIRIIDKLARPDHELTVDDYNIANLMFTEYETYRAVE
jgi:hypothetical protein